MDKLTRNEFIEKCVNIHKDKYDYTKVEYINNKTKVCILCPEHGEFWIRPNDLLSGSGCPKCGGTKKLTTDEFIKKAKIIHNNFFSYEKTIYINSNEKENIKSQLSAVQKENEQLRVSIENSLNLNSVEKSAEEKLGMQKLDNNQKIYLYLQKKDYVEPASEEIVIEEELSWFEEIIKKLTQIIK